MFDGIATYGQYCQTFFFVIDSPALSNKVFVPKTDNLFNMRLLVAWKARTQEEMVYLITRRKMFNGFDTCSRCYYTFIFVVDAPSK
jgi:hypothetical protein